MTSLIVVAIEKIATALLPLVLKWVGDEALALITHGVAAENTARTNSVAAAEASAPSDRAELVQTLKQGAF
ncbi:MAG TPA: hypothetical protein VGM17_17740 [Rhizomicrobium sp.]|jgi:hypothetical protein